MDETPVSVALGGDGCGKWEDEEPHCNAGDSTDVDCSAGANERCDPTGEFQCFPGTYKDLACAPVPADKCKCSHPPCRSWQCESGGGREARSERSNSESSTCAADRSSSPPPSPQNVQLAVSVSSPLRPAVGDFAVMGAPPDVPEASVQSSPRTHGLAQEGVLSTSLSCPPAQRDVACTKPRLSSCRGFLDAFYSRQREQQMNELKSRYEAHLSLTTWGRGVPNSSSSRASGGGNSSSLSSSSMSSSSVLSRFLRSSSLTKQQLRRPLTRGATGISQMSMSEQQLQLQMQEEQLQQQEQELKEQQSLLYQLQIRAGERPRGALVTARSQMLQREQQQDAHARRCGVPSGFAGASPLLLSQQHHQVRHPLERIHDGSRRRRHSLPSRLNLWGPAAGDAAAFAAAGAAENEACNKMHSDRPAEGPVAKELGEVAAEAAAKAAAQSAAAAAAGAAFRESVEFFRSLRRTASDAQLCTRPRGPCWAGQKQLSRAWVGELLDRALEVGAVTAAVATAQEAAAVARSVEGLVAALQVRVAQGHQRVKLHFLMQQVCRNKNNFPASVTWRRHASMGTDAAATFPSASVVPDKREVPGPP